MNRTAEGKKGFTFIEVMIVAAIMSVVGLTIGTAVNNGLSIYKRVRDMSLDEDTGIFFDRLTLDLKNSIRYKGMEYSGDQETLSVPLLVDSKSGGLLPGVALYVFKPGENAVYKSKADISELYEGSRQRHAKVLSRVISLEFTYYLYDPESGMYFWSETVQGDLPQAVRVSVEFRLSEGRKVYAKTISVPVSKIEPLQG